MILHCFYDDEISITKKKIVFMSAFTVGYSILEPLTKHSIVLPIIISLIYYSISGLTAAAGAKGKRFKRTIKYMVCCFVFEMTVISISLLWLYFVNRKNTIKTLEPYYPQYASTMLLSELFMMIIILYLYKQFIRKSLTMPFRRVDKIFVFLYSVYIFLMDTIYSWLSNHPDFVEGYETIRLFLTLVIIAVAMLIPIFILRNRQTGYFNKLSEQHMNFLEAELAASKQFREAQEETRAFRHDVQNNLSVLSMLMREGKYSEAEQFINDMHTQVSALSPKIVTGDEMLDSLIASKYGKMNESEIEFTINGVADGGIGWKAIDICTVFANALDNAIEACMRVEDEEKRFIKLEFRKTAHQRLITLCNSSAEDVDCEKLIHSEEHVTAKTDKLLHGYGVRNIKRTIEKYGGMFRMNCTNGEFKLEMILELNGSDEQEP